MYRMAIMHGTPGRVQVCRLLLPLEVQHLVSKAFWRSVMRTCCPALPSALCVLNCVWLELESSCLCDCHPQLLLKLLNNDECFVHAVSNQDRGHWNHASHSGGETPGQGCCQRIERVSGITIGCSWLPTSFGREVLKQFNVCLMMLAGSRSIC